jgi:hypothetical protein
MAVRSTSRPAKSRLTSETVATRAEGLTRARLVKVPTSSTKMRPEVIGSAAPTAASLTSVPAELEKLNRAVETGTVPPAAAVTTV